MCTKSELVSHYPLTNLINQPLRALHALAAICSPHNFNPMRLHMFLQIVDGGVSSCLEMHSPAHDKRLHQAVVQWAGSDSNNYSVTDCLGGVKDSISYTDSVIIDTNES